MSILSLSKIDTVVKKDHLVGRGIHKGKESLLRRVQGALDEARIPCSPSLKVK